MALLPPGGTALEDAMVKLEDNRIVVEGYVVAADRRIRITRRIKERVDDDTDPVQIAAVFFEKSLVKVVGIQEVLATESLGGAWSLLACSRPSMC